MDTQYKFAEHTPMDPTTERGKYVNKFGFDNTRQYVGPRGWIISRNVFTKKWQMNHANYQDQYLTIQDTALMYYRWEDTSGRYRTMPATKERPEPRFF